MNPQTFVHPFGNTNVSYSDVLFGPFSSLFFSDSSNYLLKLKHFCLKEPSERPETQASNRDSDDDERDCDSNKLKGHSENPRQMQQETNEDMSKEPSTSR